MGIVGDLYHGRTKYKIVAKTRMWFAISGVVLVIGLASLGVRHLNLGIDFEGGVVWEFPAADLTVDTARDFIVEQGVVDPKVQTLTGADGAVRLRIQGETMDPDDQQALAKAQVVQQALAQRVDAPLEEVSISSVGPSWGRTITAKAIRALFVFLIAITIYVTLRFELKMAIATLIALVHDVLLTVGVYSVTGFEVTPPTVIAILTILGFSIYDGIVVFDKVDENTRLVSSTNRVTYSDMIDLSLNQTLMRSLNTSITALLPILSLLIVGSLILGATTLQEFALALLIGLASGAYSSIFIASPMLALLKEREPRYRDVRRRIEAREASSNPAAIVDEDTAGGDDGDGSPRSRKPVPVAARTGPALGAPTGAIPPRPRKKTRKR
jgi:preprotein translocase subunit SecF